MDATFVDRPLISRERMHQLNARRNGPAALRLAIQLVLYLCAAGVLVLADAPAVIGLALAASGLVQFSFFGMLHEACHRTAFTTKRANDVAGWVAALAQPMSPALMRAFHYEHHRYTHVLERDPELGGQAFMVPWPRGLAWLGTMSGLPFLVARFGWTLFAAVVPRNARAWEAVLPFVNAEARPRVIWEARVLCLIHGGAMTAAALWHPPIWRVYIALWIGHALLGLYVTCEHRGLPEGRNVPILEKTRSLQTPWVLRWMLWNMPYHAEHHGWPSVPFHRLPELHREIRDHLVHRERPIRLHLTGGRGLGPRAQPTEQTATPASAERVE
jgi:fatty acid desaturase